MAAARPAEHVPDPRLTPQPLVLVGGGEHACVVADVALSTGLWEIVAVADPAAVSQSLTRHGAAHLRDDEDLTRMLARAPDDGRPWLVLGVGAIVDGSARRTLAGRYERQRWASLVHATAWVSPEATVCPGAVVMAGAIVNSGARIGAHAIVNTGAVVEHHVEVGEFARLAPGAIIGGGVSVGTDVLVGLGASVRDHVTIGDRAVVGMGAVVTQDVDAGTTVVGIPARPRQSSRFRRMSHEQGTAELS